MRRLRCNESVQKKSELTLMATTLGLASTGALKATSMQGRHITIPLNLCKQCDANLQGVGPNPHTPYVHANHEIDQSQVSSLNAYDKIPSKV
jgi:hypothetical protein